MTETIGVQKLRESLGAFGRGDITTAASQMADDIVWHQPGTSFLAGEYKGRDFVVEFFGRLLEETGGTFHSEVHDVVGNDEHVVALMHISADRKGKHLDQNVVNVFHVNGEGQATERWLFVEDLAALDDFWS